jgi:hypothetical protein
MLRSGERLRSIERRGIPVKVPSRAMRHHPVTGPITVAQSLTMLEGHLDRHIKQIDRILP